jgi:hypothetical protein
VSRALRTAYDDFRDADAWFGQGIYSTALPLYESAVGKLTDADATNDGPDPVATLSRSRYGAAVCLTTIPLEILEGMLADILGGDTGALSRFIVEDYRRRTGDDDLPTNLLTIYLRDWIVPGLERANDRLDAVLADPVFFYELPAIRLTLFGKAITLPDVASPEDRGRHDRVEAAVLSAVLHAVEWAFRSVLSYNIDMDIARIDDVLWLIRNGDWGALFGFLGEYPRFLDPSTPETNGIDGRAMLLAAYDDFSTFVLRLRDDDDQDGTWDAIDVRGGIDPGEEADDLIDAFFLDDGLQLWDVLLRTPEGIGINVRVNGEGRRGSELERGLNVALFGLLNSDAAGRIARGVLGLEPPEADARNGIDDDYAVGRSTSTGSMSTTGPTATARGTSPRTERRSCATATSTSPGRSRSRRSSTTPRSRSSTTTPTGRPSSSSASTPGSRRRRCSRGSSTRSTRATASSART